MLASQQFAQVAAKYTKRAHVASSALKLPLSFSSIELALWPKLPRCGFQEWSQVKSIRRSRSVADAVGIIYISAQMLSTALPGASSQPFLDVGKISLRGLKKVPKILDWNFNMSHVVCNHCCKGGRDRERQTSHCKSGELDWCYL